MFFFLFWHVKNLKVNLMVNVKMATLSTTFVLKKSLNTSLKDLSLASNIHGRNGLFSFLKYLPSSVLGKRDLVALLNLSSWCLVMVVWLFLAIPRGCLRFVIVVFPDHSHLLFLRNSELEANKLYDRAYKLYKAALFTRCYVQHFLSLYIDYEVNHKWHFIKIPFINKIMEFIDLHSIFKDNLVISSIPTYF